MENPRFLDLLKNPVFTLSATLIAILALTGALIPERFGSVTGRLYLFTTEHFGWLYLISVFCFVIFLVGLALSRYGNIRLGREDERPEFRFYTWVGMLFSAGFGIGLVFWGVAEPMSHFYTSPFSGNEAQTTEAARIAMGYSFFHWGVNQWAIFGIVGLVIAYFQFRRKQNGLVSTALEPVLGKHPWVKDGVDSLAVIATVMGVATSLGLGVLQMNGGLSAVFGIPNTGWVQILIIMGIFSAYILSTITGLGKGIKYLSIVNMTLVLFMLLVVFIAGPTVFILETFTLGMGDYLTHFVNYSLRLTPYEGGVWVRDWTLFYWAWVIAWSPFVGAFVARVSRGRTIREFIFGVMIVPPLIACFWFAVFGGTALYSDLNAGTQIAEAVNRDVTVALFELFNILPFSTLLSLMALLLITTFLITSADSASYILGSMTTRGSLTPPLVVKIIWGVLISAIAGALLFAGGLEALQTASLVAAVPFCIIMILMVAALVRLLRRDVLPISKTDMRRFLKVRARLDELEGKNKDDDKVS
ncbi:BCCT family transporter [Ectothiorhodospira lacustris]|uniref:BCCT family transporter n=1 Tax=Ectothiorhodospira lacustris TaxID=2899127 RepID=UPI001EE89670|nr:BCCT family transporter [Ectothiorhodospira lacustris]MCG5500979.1 BCCT family transporter [Ectothiorhodospira lacustris]MCG5510021.1 BCCT family transporter [Ectothiorhodospira lacustris]MCG5521767.1 BCCT family transporter [Ectothiorhodospira lacustris]